jgi:hypothetical protein
MIRLRQLVPVGGGERSCGRVDGNFVGVGVLDGSRRGTVERG